MPAMTDDKYIGVLLETIRDQNKAVLEAVGDVQRRVTDIESKVDNLPTRQEFTTAVAAITDTSKQLHKHEAKHRGHFRVRHVD